MELPEALKKYNFAPLPPRIYRQDEEQENQKKETGRYDVQCQICGRMGAMSLEDMKKHAETHGLPESDQIGR